MRICLINNLYKPFSRGGAEKIVELTAHGLKEAGHQVFIITTSPRAGAAREAEEGKIKIYRFGVLNFSSYYNLARLPKFLRLFWHVLDMFDLGSFFKVRKILKEERPELVITHNLKGAGFLIPSAIRSLGIKHYHVLHDIQLLHPSGLMIYEEEGRVDAFWAKLYQAANRRLFASPQGIISPSRWLLDEHLSRGFFKHSQTTFLPNPVSPSFKPLKGERLRGKDFRFLYVGQVEEHKGIIFLIENFKFFLDNVGGGELTIVGGGSRLEKIRQLADRPEIKLLGRQDREEVRYLMNQADCLIVPSLCYENSPSVIYEAFSAGLPVMASSLGGTRELLENGCGVLFRPADKEDFLEKLEWVIGHGRELREIKARAGERIKRFNINNYLTIILGK